MQVKKSTGPQDSRYNMEVSTHGDAVKLSLDTFSGTERTMDWSKSGLGRLTNELFSFISPLVIMALFAFELAVLGGIKIVFFPASTPPELTAVFLGVLTVNAIIAVWALLYSPPLALSSDVYAGTAACRGIRAAQARGAISKADAKALLKDALAFDGAHFRKDIKPLAHMMVPRTSGGGLADVVKRESYLVVTHGERTLGLKPGDSGGVSFSHIEVVSPCCGFHCSLIRGAQVCGKCRQPTLLPTGNWVGQGTYGKLLGDYLGLDIMAQALARGQIEDIFAELWITRGRWVELDQWATW